jgi:hypothetical protein
MRKWRITAVALGVRHSRMTVVHEWRFAPAPQLMRHLCMGRRPVPTPYVIVVVVRRWH